MTLINVAFDGEKLFEWEGDAFRILFTSSPRRPISYTLVGSLGCRDRRAVWLDRAPADINNIAGAATRR